MEKTIFEGEGIFKLIPQRPPMVMIDKVLTQFEIVVSTCLTIEKDNIFVDNGELRESGIVEHIAQSAAAMTGYSTFLHGNEPMLGFIGEVKKCCFFKLPEVGDTLETKLEVIGEAAGVTLLNANTQIVGTEQKVAECQMKIFLKQ